MKWYVAYALSVLTHQLIHKTKGVGVGVHLHAGNNLPFHKGKFIQYRFEIGLGTGKQTLRLYNPYWFTSKLHYAHLGGEKYFELTTRSLARD